MADRYDQRDVVKVRIVFAAALSAPLSSKNTFEAHALEAHKASVDFDWNTAKSEVTREERGFGFDFAALIFAGPTIEILDARRAYGETRIKAIGEADGLVLVVIYTDRAEVRRIISARRANRQERALWHSRE